MGLDNKEIREGCDVSEGELDFVEEMANLKAAQELKTNNITVNELNTMSDKGKPPAGWLD